MARKRKGGRKMPMWKKALKTVGGVGSGILIAGPVVIPGTIALQTAISGGGPVGAYNSFVKEASGFDPATNQFYPDYLFTTIIPRDIATVAVGMALRWALKRV